MKFTNDNLSACHLIFHTSTHFANDIWSVDWSQIMVKNLSRTIVVRCKSHWCKVYGWGSNLKNEPHKKLLSFSIESAEWAGWCEWSARIGSPSVERRICIGNKTKLNQNGFSFFSYSFQAVHFYFWFVSMEAAQDRNLNTHTKKNWKKNRQKYSTHLPGLCTSATNEIRKV